MNKELYQQVERDVYIIAELVAYLAQLAEETPDLKLTAAQIWKLYNDGVIEGHFWLDIIGEMKLPEPFWSRKQEPFKVGQKVKWLWTQRSGWNLQSWVDGEVTKVTNERVQIEAVNRFGNTVRRWIKPENVKPMEQGASSK